MRWRTKAWRTSRFVVAMKLALERASSVAVMYRESNVALGSEKSLWHSSSCKVMIAVE